MKLKKLKELIDSLYNDSGYKEFPDQLNNIDVVVITSEESIGGRSCSNVDTVNLGFDWEMNRLNIETEHKLKKVKA